MSGWRVLELSDSADDQSIPQLLIKPQFDQEAYILFVTDLSNIWSEHLNLTEIIERASQQESPIEVSEQDTSQLGILLENIARSLASGEDAVRQIVKDKSDGVVLHAAISLPAPLGSLRWHFSLSKKTPVTLKNELILPLLVSSHIQQERVNGLVASIQEKDRVITRLVDQYESSNLDLASAFPSIAGAKPGRRVVKREQAARLIPGLQPFHADNWKEETAELEDGDVSTLGLFQEALSECTPKVPVRMKTDDENDAWWTSIRKKLDVFKLGSRPKPKKVDPPVRPPPEPSDDETETEDEFETHENFKLRQSSKGPVSAKEAPVRVDKKPNKTSDAGSETEEDDDLDAPSKSQSKNRSRNSPKKPVAGKAAEPEASPLEAATAPTKKAKGLRIGGSKAKQVESPPPEVAVGTNGQDEEMPDVSEPATAQADTEVATPKSKRTFKIGGKSKAHGEITEGVHPASPSPRSHKTKRSKLSEEQSPGRATSQKASASAQVQEKASTPEEEVHEETAEEKAERKRRELKRKNEELVKKQAHKKKKRF